MALRDLKQLVTHKLGHELSSKKGISLLDAAKQIIQSSNMIKGCHERGHLISCLEYAGLGEVHVALQKVPRTGKRGKMYTANGPALSKLDFMEVLLPVYKVGSKLQNVPSLIAGQDDPALKTSIRHMLKIIKDDLPKNSNRANMEFFKILP